MQQKLKIEIIALKAEMSGMKYVVLLSADIVLY